MAHETHEFEGKSVDDAIAAGLSQLNLTHDQVSIEVLSKGSRGILGFGSEPAHVRITPLPTSSSVLEQVSAAPTDEAQAAKVMEEIDEDLPATADDDTFESAETVTMEQLDSVQEVEETEPTAESDVAMETSQEPEEDEEELEETELDDQELADLAGNMLLQMIELMGFNARVEVEWREPDEQGNTRYLRLDIQGEDLGVLIGRRGETLTSIQYLLRLMINQRLRQWKNIVVDVERYKERRIVQLGQLAHRMADQVVETGRPISLEPMPAGERRIVHIALRDHPGVYTASVGEDERRKVEIVPKD